MGYEFETAMNDLRNTALAISDITKSSFNIQESTAQDPAVLFTSYSRK
jgi:hypothetical protein